MNPNKFIKETQVGSKFGASVAAIDITGDGFDEVFVGAPLYSGDQTEEGRVFVYTTDEIVRFLAPPPPLAPSTKSGPDSSMVECLLREQEVVGSNLPRHTKGVKWYWELLWLTLAYKEWP